MVLSALIAAGWKCAVAYMNIEVNQYWIRHQPIANLSFSDTLGGSTPTGAQLVPHWNFANDGPDQSRCYKIIPRLIYQRLEA